MQRVAYSNPTRSLCVLYRFSRGNAASLSATGWTGIPRSIAIDVRSGHGRTKPRRTRVVNWNAVERKKLAPDIS
ncbi:hypothetical protein ABIB80_007279 [Bradyrhizobium sp. i1.15.2]